MTVKMDKFGRILIPKAVREDQGLRPGDEFEIDAYTQASQGVSLTKVQRIRWVRVESELPWPVYDLVDEDGNPADVDIDWENAVRDAREERIDTIIERLS